MGPVDLPSEAREAMAVLKGKVQSVPVLVFPDFEKPFLLEMDASKEGLGMVLSQKQSDGWYHPVTFGSHSPSPVGLQAGIPHLEMECNGAFQGISRIHAICGADRQ